MVQTAKHEPPLIGEDVIYRKLGGHRRPAKVTSVDVENELCSGIVFNDPIQHNTSRDGIYKTTGYFRKVPFMYVDQRLDRVGPPSTTKAWGEIDVTPAPEVVRVPPDAPKTALTALEAKVEELTTEVARLKRPPVKKKTRKKRAGVKDGTQKPIRTGDGPTGADAA